MRFLLIGVLFIWSVVARATEIARISTQVLPTTTSLIITTIGDIEKYDHYLNRERCEFKVILYNCKTKPIDRSIVAGALLRVRAAQLNSNTEITVNLLHPVDYQTQKIERNKLEFAFENPYAPYTIERVLLAETKESTTVTLLTTQKPRYKYFHLLSPPRIIVDFLYGSVTEQVLPVKSVRVKNIEVVPHKINDLTLARIIINLYRYYQYSVHHHADKVIVYLYEELPVEKLPEKVKPPEEVKPPEIKPPEIKPPELKPPEIKPPKVKPPEEIKPQEIEIPIKKPEEITIKPEEVVPILPTQEYISLDIKGADLLDVLRLIAHKAQVNIVPYKGVSGVVTIKLKDITWKEALDVILKAQGYDYLIEDNIVKVGTPEQLKIETITKIYTCNYANAEAMAEIISKMLTEKIGYVQVEPRTNSVIITDTRKVIEKADKMLKQLDTPLPQVMIEAKLVSLSEKAKKELGIRWFYKKGADIPPVVGGTPTVPPSLPFYYKGVDVFAMGESFWFGYAKTKDDYALYAALDTLISEGKGEVLSNPKIIAVHNREAVVLSGQEVPVLSVERTGAGEFYRVAFKKVGISLTVLPRIQPDRTVLLEIKPEVSEVAYWMKIREGDVPIIKTDHATTEVLVEDGETIVIGGIIRTREAKAEKKVPILCDLPLLGHLFRQKTKEHERAEFLILLTPKIL